MATQNHHKQTSYQPIQGFRATSARQGEPAAEAAQKQKRAVSGGTAVPVRSRPFDDDKDLDPFILFERLQWPFSPLKDDSARYRQEAEAALAAKEEDYRNRGDFLTVDEIKDMIHLNYNLGKYATTTKRTPPTPESIGCDYGSPMHID
ncbi:hypothetical protein LTR37_015322 [Vermiconidia calcicola]|uniref:Uncharacterized protein n=1 Tax=Vermiconidia calcicola TaxID=1690605 RepID=A0ACC3MS53_9PEZI|nr:hypothetical protein LTR37_015322 [Vermiconidia calcicola]